MKKRVANLSDSVRQRLLNLASERKEDFGLILTRYGLERFLYRLSISPHRDSFVLKGARLMQLWTSETYRPTRDLDLLGRGVANTG
jgi:Nucleotidyl transferase AbiEii toxin, Type IV TA system